MQAHWDKYGINSSPAQMSGEIRRRFPKKHSSYIQECCHFIKQKKEELKQPRHRESDFLLLQFVGHCFNVFQPKMEKALRHSWYEFPHLK